MPTPAIERETGAARRNTSLDILLPAGVCAIFFFLFLGHNPLADWDEAIYADIAREFVHGSSKLIPYWNFHPWLERTPLFEWVTAGFCAVFGVSEFWARAAAALAGIGTVLAAYRIAQEMGGRTLAWLSLTVLITCHGFFYQARYGTTDAMLTLWMTISLLGIFRIARNELAGWIWFWTGLALGIMTKSAGPAPAVLTLLFVALKDRWGRSKISREFWLGVVLFGAIVAPWHLYMYSQFGKTFLDDYIGRQLLTRSTRALEGHTGGPLFYLWTILKSAFPWSLLFPVAVFRAIQKRRLDVLESFALVVLCFYTLIKTKLRWYILPAYPPLAIIAAQQVCWLLPKRLSAGQLRAAIAATLALLFAALLRTDLYRPGRPEVLLLKQHDLSAYAAPFILCADKFIPEIPAPLFYVDKPTVQAYLISKPNIVEGEGPIDAVTNDPKFRNPRPLEQFVSAAPSPMLIENGLVPEIASKFEFKSIAANSRFTLGTVSVR